MTRLVQNHLQFVFQGIKIADLNHVLIIAHGNLTKLPTINSMSNSNSHGPHSALLKTTTENLSSDVFDRRTSSGRGHVTLLSRDCEQFFLQIVSIRAKKLRHTNLVASRYFKREKGSLPVNVRRLKTSLLKLQETVNSLSFFLSNSHATLIRKIKRPALQLRG